MVVVVPENQIMFCTAIHCWMAHEMVLMIGNVGGKWKQAKNAICILLSTTPTNIYEISSYLHTW